MRRSHALYLKRFGLLFFLGLFMGPWAAGHSGERSLELVYSGNLNGELEPCGCAQESDLGGVMRRGTVIKQLRESMPELVLISAGGLITSESPQDKIKAHYILKGFFSLKYDAIALQWPDLGYGQTFLNSFVLPWVSSNYYDKQFPPHRMIKRKHFQLAVFTWLDPHRAPEQESSGKQAIAMPDTTALKRALSEAKDGQAITILSSTLMLPDAQKQLPLENVDILILQARDEQIGKPEKVGHMLVLRPGTRGMRLGQLTVKLKDNKLLDYQHKIIDLTRDIADEPELAKQHQAYNEAVKADYLKRVVIRKQHRSGVSPFTGDEACEVCHQQAYGIWQKSKHAHAYETLEKVGKAYDPECIGCHTVGFEQEGGFIDPMVTANLSNVQCEVCHGAGRKHVNSKGKEKTAHTDLSMENMCKQCHVGSHSPVFKLNQYWQHIKH